MRIIAGVLGGRRFMPPARMLNTRPTTDIAKEGLFNIIANNLQLDGARTLDLFGGTGNISYELASRGAGDLTIVERDAVMSAFIANTAVQLNITNIRVVRMDVFAFLDRCNEKFDLIFAGPPYALPNIEELPILVHRKKLLNPGAWFVLEHTPRHQFSSFDGFATQRNYGTTVFSIFVKK